MKDPSDLSDYDQGDYLIAPRLLDGAARFVRAWWEDDMPLLDRAEGATPQSKGPKRKNRKRTSP